MKERGDPCATNEPSRSAISGRVTTRRLAVVAVVAAVAAAAGAGGLVQASAAVGAVTASSSPQASAARRLTGLADRTEVREVFSPDGTIQKRYVTRARDEPTAIIEENPVGSMDVVTIQETGAADTRFDMVFLGDGYTAEEMDLYHVQVIARWNQLTAIEPFVSLKDRFNVWQVNVVSQQSGSDNDPTEGISRDTALDGGFWCAGLDRLLCVNDAVANQYAALAPEADQIIVLVNSTTYGGSGGSLAVTSGGNGRSGDIAIHELGHSIGGLADEYGGECTYVGDEPRAPNVSRADEPTMRSQQIKWYSYFGHPTPDGGAISAYEGGSYCDRGIFRPSLDSAMRSLGKPFNLIGVDVLTAAIRSKVR